MEELKKARATWAGTIESEPTYFTYATDTVEGTTLIEGRETAEGPVNEHFISTFDELGNKLSWSWDVEADGQMESAVTYTYNSVGQRVIEEVDNGLGGVSFRITYSYNEKGFLVGEEEDDDLDGEADAISTISPDTKGNPVTKSTDSDADGVPDEPTTYSYDCWL